MNDTLLTELFPIRADALTPLYAYVPVYANDAARTGGKLAYRLRNALGGQWQWLDGRLVSDVEPNPVKLLMAIDAVKQAAPKAFGALQSIDQDHFWQAGAQELADFVVRGALEALASPIHEALQKVAFPMKNARVERECKPRGWVVDGKPAVALSIITHVIYGRSVAEFAQTLAEEKDFIGLMVSDRTSSLQGEIVKVVGGVAQHRERLIGLSQRAVMRDLIASAPDNAFVLRIDSKGEQYDYVADALELMITLETVQRFEVPAGQVEKALHINPSLRAQLVKAAADIAKNAGILDSAYSSANAPDKFAHVYPQPNVLWGGDKARDYDRELIAIDFNKFSAWRPPGDALHVMTINALDEDAEIFVEALERELLKKHRMTLDIVKERKIKVANETNIDSAIRALAKERADVLLAFFPDDPPSDDEISALDRYLKEQSVARALPVLVIHKGTIHRPETMPHLIMGMMGRAGGAPFAFEEPLPYADQIVGLALHRQTKKDGDHLTALTRHYSNRGVALGWRAARAVVPTGGGLTEAMLDHLLPAHEIGMKRTLLHVDGRLRDDDAALLARWEEQHDAALYPIEINQRANPRLYSFTKGKIDVPQRGSAFLIDNQTALLATAGAPYTATPMPLLVHSRAQIKLTQVLDSVMTMILLHHGALGAPKLPVTVSYADEWAAGVERGFFPTVEGGKGVWWV
jgi:hypothetical protein